MTVRPLPLCSTLLALCAAWAPLALGAAEEKPAPPAAGQAQAAPAVPVRKVVLFSSGVGYFEHAGRVDGNATSELRFKTAQINDVLKSLVVEDAGGGAVSTIAYPSQDPIGKTLKSFQVDISGNPSFGDLLAQLRGARVTAQVDAESVSGTILSVEKRVKVVGERGDKVEEWILSLIAGATVRAIALDSVRSLRLDDAQLQAELDKALTALAQARDQDKKPVTIAFQGQGQRAVRLGYVVEAPVWKTSYRLLLDEDEKTKPRLQGWAIIENQTDNDWNDITLTLVSGRPISFVQDLYQPLYVPRPVVQPELFAGLRPQLYDDAVAANKPTAEFGGRREELRRAKGGMAPPAPAAPAPSMGYAMDAAQMAGEAMEAPMDPGRGVQSVANAQKLGAFFQYSVGNVTLARQRSAMIPIITDTIDAERVSIYNQQALAKHPLLGARLVNSSGKHLLQGPITVLDRGSYAGDARIDDVAPGGERLLSFAVDLEVTVQAEGRGQTAAIVAGRLVQGVLEIRRKLVRTQEYVIDNKAPTGRALIVEHPLEHGWTLVDTPKPIETTDRLHRFRDEVKPGEAKKLVVKEEHIQSEGIAILPADLGTIEFYARSGEIPAGVREALMKAVAFKRAMVDTERLINEKQQRINEITQEQERIRQNMRTVDQKSAYYQRLLEKLNAQETQLDGLRGEIDGLRAKLQQQQKELEAYVAGMTLDK